MRTGSPAVALGSTSRLFSACAILGRTRPSVPYLRFVDIPTFARLLDAPEKLTGYLKEIELRDGKVFFPREYGKQPKLDYTPESKSQIGWWKTLAIARVRHPALAPALQEHLSTIETIALDADGHDFDLELVQHATALRALKLRKVAMLRGTLRGEQLGTLEVESSDSEATLGALPALHTIRWSSRNLSSIAGFADCAATTLTLQSNQLEDIGPLATMQKLEHLELDAPVEDLAPIGTLKKLSFLALCTPHESFSAWRDDAPVGLTDLRCGRDCHRLTRLDGLEGCTALRSVWLAETRVKDVSGLRDHPVLERLDLSRTPVVDLRPLGTPPVLRKIVVSNKIRDDRIDAALIPALDPPSALKRTKKTRAKRTRAKKQLAPKPKKLASKIEKLLLARDMERIDQGVELLSALDDASLFDALLDGTRYHASRDEARLLSDGWLESSSVVLPYRRHAMRAIAGAAPEGSVGATLRAEVDTLFIDGQRTKNDRVPISLNGLGAFEKLSRLRVEQASEILRQEVLVQMRALKRFELREIAKTPQHLRVPPSLRTLVMSAPDLAGIDTTGWESLRELSLVGTTAPSLATLRDARVVRIGTRSFTKLTLDASVFRDLAKLDLDELHLHSIDPRDLGALAASSIRCLRLAGSTHVDLDTVATLNVEELWLSNAMGNKGRIDVRPLAPMRSLRRLAIMTSVDRIDGLDALETEKIAVWGQIDATRDALGPRWWDTSDRPRDADRWIDL